MLNCRGTNIFWQKFKAGKNSGQVAILGVLLIALILLFTLVTENVGRYALLKMRIDNAADGATLGLISNMGSWATFLSKTYLGWTDEECQFVWARLFSWITLIVSVFLPMLSPTITFSGWAAAGIAGGAIGLGYQYVQSAELGRTQNRQFKKMTKELQFKESAISDAFNRIVTDTQMVDDIHDWDSDGMTTDKISRIQAWLSYRYMVLGMAGKEDLRNAFRWFIRFLSGLKFEGLNGEGYDCPLSSDSCGYAGYYTNDQGNFNPGWITRFIEDDFNSWKAPGGLFAQIEALGVPEFELAFWQPDNAGNPYPNDEIDNTMEEIKGSIEFAKNSVLSLVDYPEVCTREYDPDEGEFVETYELALYILTGNAPSCWATRWTDIVDLHLIPRAETIMNQLYVPEHYDRDANGSPIFYDEEGNQIPPIVDYYDKITGWTDEFDGQEYPGWLEKIPQWRDDLQEIYDSLMADSAICDAICATASQPGSPECVQCQAQLALHQRFNDEDVLDKFTKLLEYTTALRDVIYNTAHIDDKPSLATSWENMQAAQEAASKFYYSWPIKIKTYNSQEDPDGDGYKVIWRHVKIEFPHFPNKVPYLDYDAGVLNDCIKLKKAKEYVSLRIKYYSPDIPIFYVRGANNPLQLLWRIRTRKQVQDDVDDAFNNVTVDLTGDGVIGYEDLLEAYGDPDDPANPAKVKIDTLLNDYGIISHAGGWFNWRMHNNQLQDIFE